MDEAGEVLPPFHREPDRRLMLRAMLDAISFHLCGVTGRNDIRCIYSTFHFVERGEAGAGHCRSCDLCLARTSALEAGQPNAVNPGVSQRCYIGYRGGDAC